MQIFNIKSLQQQITSESTQHDRLCLVHSKLEVSLPKFKMEQSYSLHDLLPDMGMDSVFSDSANLTRMSKIESLRVSEVSVHFHRAVTTYLHIPTSADKDFYLFFSTITGAAQGCD